MSRRRAIARNYTQSWEAIAKHVKDRAGWRCERCGHRHEPAAGYTLTVAHLDHEFGNQRFNLAALCQRCHLKYESRFHFRQGYMFEHSEWMLPHLHGWLRYRAAKARARGHTGRFCAGV